MAVRTAVNHFALFAEQVRKMIRLFKTIKTFLRGDAGTSLEFLNSVERMRGILDRERMRRSWQHDVYAGDIHLP